MSSIKDQIIDYLANEGLRPQSEEFGIFFRYQMLNFLIRWDEEDDHFIQLAIPNIFDVDDNNRMDVLTVCNSVSAERKVIKCVAVDDGVWVNAEMLLDQTPAYEDILPRAIDMVLQGRSEFYERMRKL